MKKSKWFNKQYILLSVSILLGLIVLILGSSYAYYIVNITGNDDNNDVAVKTSNINLEISNVSGKLKLCKSYPINTGEALRCTPYQFTITNNNKVSLEYYLNLEYETTVSKDEINVAFAECKDASCSAPDYNISKLSEILDNNDTISSQYAGKLLSAGNNLNKGDSKNYSVILWLDADSKTEEDTFNASISAITYTQTQDILSYTLSFDLEDNATWTTDTCKSSDGYTINGTKCEKTIGVNESYGNLPSVTINGEDVLWYSDNKFYNNKATTDTKYTMRQNTIYKSTTNSALESHTYNYTGNEQLFVVPATGVYELKTWGAQGGGYNGLGGYGGYSQGFVHLTKNQIVYIYIGGAGTASASENTAGGYNGGGASYNQSGFSTSRYFASGGGATHMTIKEGQLSTLQNNKSAILIVSGGGGGGYADTTNSINNRGGDAGGYLGNNGEQTTTGWGAFGYGGSQTKGGYSICDATTCSKMPEAIGDVYYASGSFGKGGSSSWKSAASGGGSGYYGGGGPVHVQSAGGGSGYIGNPQLFYKTMYCYNCSKSNEEATKTVSTTCHNSVATDNCAKEGNGYAIINFYKE